MRLPLGEKTTWLTSFLCPLNVAISLPVSTSHSFAVLSRLADASTGFVG